MTPHRARSERLLRFIVFPLIVTLLTLSAYSVVQADPAEFTQAQREAQELRQLIDELDAELGRAGEDYNYAAQQLEDTRVAQAETEAKLLKAESQLDGARERLLTRLADIYKAGRGSMLELLVGATSFSDLVNRARQLSRISEQDAELVAEVEAYLGEIEEHEADLAHQAEEESDQVQSLAKAREKVEAQLAAQQEALQGKEAQVAQLVEEERVRQAELAAAARAAAKAAAEAERVARAAAEAEAARQVSTTSSAAQNSTSVGATTTTKPKTTTTTKAKTTTTTKAKTTTTEAASGDSSSGGESGSSSLRSQVVDIALQYLGTPYVWAGESPSGFDCSGLVKYVYAKVGIRLPHSSAMQYGYGTHVSKSQLRPGDLVFFYSPISHVGIYIGDGKMVNARTGGVRIDNAFWSSYVGATRILD